MISLQSSLCFFLSLKYVVNKELMLHYRLFFNILSDNSIAFLFDLNILYFIGLYMMNDIFISVKN